MTTETEPEDAKMFEALKEMLNILGEAHYIKMVQPMVDKNGIPEDEANFKCAMKGSYFIGFKEGMKFMADTKEQPPTKPT
jgi:hypothetical protein